MESTINKAKTVCDYCGNAIFVEQRYMKRYRKHFCNRLCKNAYDKENRRGIDAPNFKDGSTFYEQRKIDGKKVNLHRYLAEQRLGRKLSPDEVVHHVNGNKKDNRPENLMVMSKTEHYRLHSNERWSCPDSRKGCHGAVLFGTWMTVREIAEATKLSKSTIRRHLTDVAFLEAKLIT